MFKKINELKIGSIVKLPYNNVFSYRLVEDDGDVPSVNSFETVIYAGNTLDFSGRKSALFIGELDKCGWVLKGFEEEKNLEPNAIELVKANQDKKGWFVEASYQLPVEVISEPIDEKPVSAPLSMTEQIAREIDKEILDSLEKHPLSNVDMVKTSQLKIGDIVSVPNVGNHLTDGYVIDKKSGSYTDGIVIGFFGSRLPTIGFYNRTNGPLPIRTALLPEELKSQKLTHQWTIFKDFEIQRKGNLIENQMAHKASVENNTVVSPKEIVKEQKKKVKLSELKVGQKILAPLNEYGGVIAQTSASYNPFNHKNFIECTVIKVNSNKLKDQFGSVPAISIAFAPDKEVPKLSWSLSDIKNSPFSDIKNNDYFKDIPEEFHDKNAWHIYDDYEVEVIGETPITSDETKVIEAAQAVVSNNTIDNNNLKEVKNMKQLSSYKVGDEVRVFLDEDGRICDYETVESVRAKVLAHNPSKDEVILGFPGDAPVKTTEAHKWKRLSQFGLKSDGFAFIGGFRGSRDHYAYSEAFTSPDEYPEEIYDEEEEEEEEEEEVIAVKPVFTKRHADKKVKVVPAAPVVPKRSLVDMIKSDAKEAAYRSAATQMTTGTKTAILMLLESKGKHDMVATVSEMLDTELGSALISMLLGMGLTYAPMISEDPRAKKLATEFRTSGISTSMNVVIGTAMETVVPLITNTLKGLPAEETPAVRLATPEVATTPLEEVKQETKAAAAR